MGLLALAWPLEPLEQSRGRLESAVLVPAAGHFDLEYRPLARLDGRLVAQYIAENGSLPARLDEGAVHLADARQWLCASLCTGGPLCLIIFLVVVVVVVPVLS